MKVLITGGLGFVGSNLAKYLADKDNEIVLYDNMSRRGADSYNYKRLVGNRNIKIVKGELDDIPEFVSRERISKSPFRMIYHLAAQVAVTSSYESPKSDFRINANGTFQLANSTDTPIIYASTNKVYGDNVNQIPISEKATRYDFFGEYKGKGIPEAFSIDAKKHTPYGISKLVGDLWTREKGGVANRFSCMYGENQFGNVDQGWISHFIINKQKERRTVIYGDGRQVRDILHVDDVVKLLELQAENIDKIKGEAFNIGGGYSNTISLLELVDKLNIKPEHQPERPADQKVYYSDISKAEKLLGWRPKVGVGDGIVRLESWVREHEDLF